MQVGALVLQPAFLNPVGERELSPEHAEPHHTPLFKGHRGLFP